MRSLLLMTTLVLGCTGKDNGEDSGAEEADADTDTDADTDADTDTDLAASLSGDLVTTTGAAFDDCRVQMCTPSQCRVATPKAGAFEHTGLAPGRYAFEIAPTGKGGIYASPSAPMDLAKSEARVLDADVVVPEFADSYTPSAPGTLSFEGGLEIDADPGDMYLKLGGDPHGYVAGVQAQLDWGLPLEGISGTPVAMWYLGEFDVHLKNVWSFTADNEAGLKGGTQLDIIVMDYLNQSWLNAGTATVSKDGKTIASDKGSGIPILSTLLLVDPS